MCYNVTKSKKRLAMGKDIRKETSKRLIKESLNELLKNDNLNRITVQRICEEAEISRTTLYRYYSSVDDIILDIEKDCVAKLMKIVTSVKNADTAIILNALFSEIQAEPGYLKIAFFDTDRFNNIVTDTMFPYVKEKMSAEWKGKTEGQQLLLFRFIVYGVNGLIKDWIDSKFTRDTKMIAEIIKDISF